MKNTSAKGKYGLAIALIVTVALFVVFVWLASVFNGQNANQAQISTVQPLRRGSTGNIVCNFGNCKKCKGQRVTWTVGNKTYQTVVDQTGKTNLQYTATQTGEVKVTAKTKHKTADATVEVLPPLITYTAQNYTITYGEDLPQMTYSVSGLPKGENMPKCEAPKCVVNASKLNVGVYDVQLQGGSCPDGYQTEYKCGKLTVLPKQLTVMGPITKTYDQTNCVQNPNLHIEGLLKGDTVHFECPMLYLNDKNVGQKQASLAYALVVGEDCANYVFPDSVTVNVLPKPINLQGLQIQNKSYDGTTKATVQKTGTLVGVCEGDSVAVGSIEAHFDTPQIGKQPVLITQVVLVGLDKDNYQLDQVVAEEATITTTLWGKLFGKNPAIFTKNG